MTIVKEISREHWIRHDLRSALIHECGHSIIARYFGDDVAHVQIFLRYDVDPRLGKLIGGRCRYRLLRGRELQIMGIAGVIAEDLSKDCSDPLELVDLIETGIIDLSETDALLAGHITEDLIDECAGILRRYWAELITQALRFASMFMVGYEDDSDIVSAVNSVVFDLEAMRGRFVAKEAA